MTHETLLSLALQAVDDEDARVVLGDAIEESGWTPPARLPSGPYAIEEALGMRTEWPDAWALAVAAVLLFGDWSTEMWPVAERCWVFPPYRGYGGFTRENFRRLVHNVAVMRGYGNANIVVSEPALGTVRAHIEAPVPETVLAAIDGDLLAYLPVYVRLELTSQASRQYGQGCEAADA